MCFRPQVKPQILRNSWPNTFWMLVTMGKVLVHVDTAHAHKVCSHGWHNFKDLLKPSNVKTQHYKFLQWLSYACVTQDSSVGIVTRPRAGQTIIVVKFPAYKSILYSKPSTQSLGITSGKETPFLLHKRLGGPQGGSGRVRKISPPPGFDLRSVQPVASLIATDKAFAHQFAVLWTNGLRLTISSADPSGRAV